MIQVVRIHAANFRRVPMKRLLSGVAVALSGLLFLAPVTRAAPDAPTTAAVPTTQPQKFIRFIDRGDAGGELDTADVTFANDHGTTVHLVAAVHVGERSYYEELAKSFEGYDALLYELIMSKDAAPPSGSDSGERSTDFVSESQQLLKRILNLEFQLDVIDYTKPNFVHADLDKETFQKMEADRGESLLSLMVQQAIAAWSNPPQGMADDPNADYRELVQLLCRPDGERQLKLILAKQMDDLEAISAGLDGPGGSVILTERNKAAMATLDRTLAAGKTNVAIFFGAAHMPDMSKRLAERGFSPVNVQWHRAWDMTVRPNEPSMAEKLLNGLIDSMGSDSGK
jgi:hypothetical protein